MVGKSQIKLIRSLHQKKQRRAERLFIAEGVKVISELLQSRFELVHLYQTDNLFGSSEVAAQTLISSDELSKISALTTPNNCLAVFKIPSDKTPHLKGLVVALDDIRDPGNLGTIIRLCDWFGVTQIICSPECADVYNPKVVQAGMGSIARVEVGYADLDEVLSNTGLPIFGTFMDGTEIYSENLPENGIIVFGNEANGISDRIASLVTKRISIPRFGAIQATESLNVATATAVVLSEFRRSVVSEK